MRTSNLQAIYFGGPANSWTLQARVWITRSFSAPIHPRWRLDTDHRPSYSYAGPYLIIVYGLCRKNILLTGRNLSETYSSIIMV
jgi:hypothetical protein